MDTTITYLDHAASAPMREEAIQAMLPYLREQYANPSGSHRFARQARMAVDESRDRVAAVVGCHPNEVVFTGCGTESDNMAITGAVTRARSRGSAGLAVCSTVEHHAVLEVVEHHGGHVIGTDRAGRIDLDQLTDTLVEHGDDIAVVSAMTVNNEVGSINDIAAIGRLTRRHATQAVFHTDAVQAASWIDLRNITPHVDLLALSGHKFGGPKGVGVLIERGGPKVDPLIIGGGQERERRSGTHNTAGIVALAVALELTDTERDAENLRIAALRDRLVAGLLQAIPGVRETLDVADKVAGSAHVCISGVESEALLYLLDEGSICASAASACASGAMEPSHVLAAMGVPRHEAMGALRLTLGHTTQAADVDRGIAVITDAVAQLRAGSSVATPTGSVS